MSRGEVAADLVVLAQEDFRLLGEEDFGSPGVSATEVVGPFVPTRAIGPLVMVHEGVIQPHLGIGHHPHRMNERLFYMLEGSLDHDDSLNGITGHMGPGDLARLTEGRRGMWHREWNNGDGTARAFILVYPTEPMPERASFDALRDLDAPRYEEAGGVRTKELVAPLEGRIDLNGTELGERERAVVPPGRGGSLRLRASGPARVLRVTFGPGFGFVRR